jgi:hypothetical protein
MCELAAFYGVRRIKKRSMRPPLVFSLFPGIGNHHRLLLFSKVLGILITGFVADQVCSCVLRLRAGAQRL